MESLANPEPLQGPLSKISRTFDQEPKIVGRRLLHPISPWPYATASTRDGPMVTRAPSASCLIVFATRANVWAAANHKGARHASRHHYHARRPRAKPMGRGVLRFPSRE